MSDDIAIKVENVSKQFLLPHQRASSIKTSFLNPFTRIENEKQMALDGVSFEVKKGEFFGIVGRNGSGKSTLLKCMAGVYTPDKGHIKVNGSLVPFIELGVGFNPELSGRDNVYLNGALLGFSRTEIDAMYEEIVDFAELEKFMDQKLKNYSSGMQVRLAFSIAIKARGEILLLDEVLAVGDAAFQQKCFNYFEELKSKKQTIVIVSHNMEAIKRFCTKAVFLKDGVIIKEGNVHEIADTYLEENIDQINKGRTIEARKLKNISKYNIEYSIVKEDNESVKFKVNYNGNMDKCFVSLSVWKEGVLIGAISTKEEKPLKSTGKLEFTLNKKTFNPGAYVVGGGLFRMDNQSQLVVVKPNERISFLVAGEEKRRGGALKLEDTWLYG